MSSFKPSKSQLNSILETDSPLDANQAKKIIRFLGKVCSVKLCISRKCDHRATTNEQRRTNQVTRAIESKSFSGKNLPATPRRSFALSLLTSRRICGRTLVPEHVHAEFHGSGEARAARRSATRDTTCAGRGRNWRGADLYRARHGRAEPGRAGQIPATDIHGSACGSSPVASD